ncbi:type 2 lanthipeptide synthetase LanM [Streptomyces sparsogenes]|uniref:Cytolysin B transport protein n=1 Tax=Streptomyces sparsogenes DSM 40356 TaxID=1331668 RepID=A0A1R1S7Q0_9ACTN|nr:type 2 lanthipeptide synthetase LanM [Streptomyces sparsogenes]OMI34129.1 cytolysin B transport protein [Streptomyces sparsogenes DSM 40356]
MTWNLINRRSAQPRRVPTITQVAQTECGLCCCVAVLRYHGRAEEISTARQVMEAGRDGLSATQLARFLRERGMEAKLFRVKDVAALAKFTSPVILYWEDYHFVVLERFDGHTAVIMDPALGRRRLGRKELEASFSGIAVSAEPGPDFERTPRKFMADWRGIPLFAKGSRRRIALVGLLSLGGYGGTLGIPMLTEWAVDRYVRWGGLDDLATVLSVIVAVAIGYFALYLLRVAVLSSVVAMMGEHLMIQTFSKLLSLPYKFFTTRQPGELLFRLNSVNVIRDLLSSRVAQGVLDVGTLLCVSGYLLIAEWRLGLIAAALSLANALYLVKTRIRVLESVDAEMTHLSKSQSAQLDAIVSVPTIKMGGYAAEFLASWSKVYASSLQAMKDRMRLQQGRITGLTATTQMFGPLILLLSSLYLVGHGQISLGQAMAVQTVSGTYFALSTSVFQTCTEFAEASRYMARLNDIAETPSEDRGGDLKQLPSTSIRLTDVGFQYTRHSEPVLSDVSIDIPAGAKVALVGPSGSGKSTLGRIICGLYEPTRGTIEFGGRDMSEYDKDSLRRSIGYIPQEVHLHNRTILENLTMGQDIPEEQVREFCESVGILDFLEDLPMGLNTLISEMGANFSGGQRQRLAIVRTLLQRPSILVLDEATASLDTINERRVTDIIQDIGATQIIIAHRLATIKAADRIYVLDGGRVVEQGSHEELLNGGSVYMKLYADGDPDALVAGREKAAWENAIGPEGPICDPDVALPAFLPFYQHLVPRSSVVAALREVMAPATRPERHEAVVDTIWGELLTAVEGHSFRTLIGEFHTFREGLGLPMTADGDEALQRFRRHLGAPGTCRRIADAYPVLRQRLSTLLDNSLDAYTDMFCAYTADQEALRAAGLTPRTAAAGELIEDVFLTGSDPHNDNRQVVGVRLTSGTKLVFKPRALATDGFVRDLYAAADPYLSFSLRECLPVSVTSGSHGWQQFVPSEPMTSPDQPARYFYRFGALCAILSAIGASDLHDENLLARGENPCVIDTETILRPDAGVENDTLPHLLINHTKLSVVSTMLVPSMSPASPVDFLMAGVGVAGDQPSKMTKTVVRDPGTDGMSVGRDPITYRQDANLPRLGDAPLSATDYFSDVLAGYTDALEFVRGGAIPALLDTHRDMPVRYVLRATLVYSRFMDASTHPSYLARPEEAERLFGLLGNSGQFTAELAQRIAAEERAGMHTGNVPYFSSRADSTDLATSRARFPEAFTTSSLDHARRGVALNAARPDHYHHFLLEECFSEVFGEDSPAGLSRHSVFAGPLRHARAGAWWPEIARRIADLGVTLHTPDGPRTGWLGGIGPGRDAATITPGNFVSFHDMGGITAFLNRANRLDDGFRTVHHRADRGLDDLLAEYGEGLRQTPESVFSGAASLLLTRPQATPTDWLGPVLDEVDTRAAAGHLETDLSNGPAGLLMVLLSRLEAGDDPAALCGEPRLARLRDLALGHLRAPRTAPWFDLAHGELGLQWARARVGRVLGDEALARASADWLTVRAGSGTGGSFAGWCNGAAGLLLASAEILFSAGRPDELSGRRLTTLVEAATRLRPGRPVDLSVCHGSSGVIQSLIATARVLGDDSLLTRAHEYQELVLTRARENGFFTGSPGRTSLLGYMLGWAGIGDTDALLHATEQSHDDGFFRVPVAMTSGFARLAQPVG